MCGLAACRRAHGGVGGGAGAGLTAVDRAPASLRPDRPAGGRATLPGSLPCACVHVEGVCSERRPGGCVGGSPLALLARELAGGRTPLPAPAAGAALGLGGSVGLKLLWARLRRSSGAARVNVLLMRRRSLSWSSVCSSAAAASSAVDAAACAGAPGAPLVLAASARSAALSSTALFDLNSAPNFPAVFELSAGGVSWPGEGIVS